LRTIKKRHNKQIISFILIYSFLLGSLIYFSTSKQTSPSNDSATTKTSEVSHTFSKEFKIYEEKKLQKELESKGKWKPSKSFLIISISIASVLDIVIIVLWAKHENKKRESKDSRDQRRWTDKKWFWNIVAMGIVQPKNNRIVMNWRNFILFLLSMYLLKVLLFRLLDL
jgi:hypothetical protein